MTDATIDHRGNEGSDHFPDASPDTLLSIATRAQKRAEEAEAEGNDDPDHHHMANQEEYGCAWQWGDGTEIRDQVTGAIIPDEDMEPCARVYDCDGETIEIITS